jgi:hypothetical protein
LTTIVPFMLAWIPQTYEYVPGVANVRAYVAPVPSGALPVVPSPHFTLCVGASWLVQVTVVPDVTVRVAGANAKFWIVIALVVAGAWLAAGLAAVLAAGLAAATLAAGLAGAVVGLAAPPHAASATLAEIARPVISARRMGFPSGSMRGGGRQPGARPLARIMRLGTPAGCLPVSEAVA